MDRIIIKDNEVYFLTEISISKIKELLLNLECKYKLKNVFIEKFFNESFAILTMETFYLMLVSISKNEFIDFNFETDITFKEATSTTGLNTGEEVKYPNEQLLINQLGEVDELVIGGYHAQDCVKRVGEKALENGINTLIDLDLTDLFFSLYRYAEYFKVEEYNPAKFKSFMIKKSSRYGEEFATELFNRNYQSQVYGFDDPIKSKTR